MRRSPLKEVFSVMDKLIWLDAPYEKVWDDEVHDSDYYNVMEQLFAEWVGLA